MLARAARLFAWRTPWRVLHVVGYIYRFHEDLEHLEPGISLDVEIDWLKPVTMTGNENHPMILHTRFAIGTA